MRKADYDNMSEIFITMRFDRFFDERLMKKMIENFILQRGCMNDTEYEGYKGHDNVPIRSW